MTERAPIKVMPALARHYLRKLPPPTDCTCDPADVRMREDGSLFVLHEQPCPYARTADDDLADAPT